MVLPWFISIPDMLSRLRPAACILGVCALPGITLGRKKKLVRNQVAHGDAREGKWRGNWRMEWVASTLTPPPNVVYPALLKLMRTPRLPAVDWTDAPTDLNGLVRSGERRNLVSARVPSRSARAISYIHNWYQLQIIPRVMKRCNYHWRLVLILTHGTAWWWYIFTATHRGSVLTIHMYLTWCIWLL